MTKYERELHITEGEIADWIVEVERNSYGIISTDYIRPIAEKIANGVLREIWETADRNCFNDSDLRLAVGRVLCDRLGIEECPP